MKTTSVHFPSMTLKALPLFVVCLCAATQRVYIWLRNLFSGSISAPKMCLRKTAAAPELRVPLRSIPFPRSPFVFFFKGRLPASPPQVFKALSLFVILCCRFPSPPHPQSFLLPVLLYISLFRPALEVLPGESQSVCLCHCVYSCLI